VPYETALRCASAYTRNMRGEYAQAVLTALWMPFIGAVGYAAGMTSHVGWIALLLLAVTPAVIMIRFWGAPTRAMSVRPCVADLRAGLDRGGPTGHDTTTRIP